MNFKMNRRGVLHIGAGMAAALHLPAVRAHEFFSSSLTVLHPWTRASAEGATSAIVSMKFEDVVEADSLVGAQSPVCDGAEFGGVGVPSNPSRGYEFQISKGSLAELSEAGTFLRLTGLKFPLELGREYPLTLVFAKAGPLRAALLIDYPPLG